MNVKDDDQIHGWEYRDAILEKYQACGSSIRTADAISAKFKITICSSQVLKVIRQMGKPTNPPRNSGHHWKNRRIKQVRL